MLIKSLQTLENKGTKRDLIFLKIRTMEGRLDESSKLSYLWYEMCEIRKDKSRVATLAYARTAKHH